MDNINLLQLIMSDGVLSLELLALFAIGFYLIASISAFPKRVGSYASYSKSAALRSSKLRPSNLQIGFNFATIVGVGAVVSPPRTWLRQNTRLS